MKQECYNPEPLEPLKEIISFPNESKRSISKEKVNSEKNQDIKKEFNDNNINDLFFYQATENKLTYSNLNREIKNSKNIKKSKKEDISEFETNKRNGKITNSNNILSTMFQTNMNDSKSNNKNKKNENFSISNSSNKIHIKKDLFNINEENIKYTNLDLEVISSWNLPKGFKLHIKKDKLENSLRNGNDGKIYFGYEKEIVNQNHNTINEPKIDYLLLPKDNEYNDKFIGIHFMIRYDKEKYKYYIKDLGSGYGTFIKIINPLNIINNLLINIGDSFIVFSLDEGQNLTVKIFTGDQESETYEYSPNKKMITIGRDKDSDIFIEDKLLSRKQCFVYFKEDKNDKRKSNWFISDGDINGKKSTNDTWMYSFKDTLIYDQMLFKNNHNLFKCNCN